MTMESPDGLPMPEFALGSGPLHVQHSCVGAVLGLEEHPQVQSSRRSHADSWHWPIHRLVESHYVPTTGPASLCGYPPHLMSWTRMSMT